MQRPEVSYARSGDVAVAYQVVGEGPTDLIFVRGIAGDLLSTWEQPLLVRHVEGLAACGLVLMVDKRGTGLSDRVREVHSAETAMDDVRAVMDAVGSETAVFWTGGTSTGIGVLFAATLFGPRPVRPKDQGDSVGGLPVGTDRGRMAQAAHQRAHRVG